jgi:hypothetical protein
MISKFVLLFSLVLLICATPLIAQQSSPPGTSPFTQTNNSTAQTEQAPKGPRQPATIGNTNRPPVTVDPFANLSPEERRAKMEEWRQKRGLTNAGPARLVSPQERRAKLESRLAELRQKKADGSITPAEERQLQSLEQFTRLRSVSPVGTNTAAEKPVEPPK